MSKTSIPKPGSIGFGTEFSDEELKAQKKAILKSPDISTLSEPWVSDNGRTLVYFKKGTDVEAEGRKFDFRRNKVNLIEEKGD